MGKHAVDLLTNLGVSADEAVRIDSLPETDSFDSKPVTQQVRENFQTQFQNDPEFFSGITVDKLPPAVKKQIESAQFGRAAKITTDKLVKALGMTEADYADLPEETKEKIELLIPAIAEKYTKTKAGDKQLQADLIAARKELEKYGADYEQGIASKYETAAESKVTAAIFNANLVGELSAIQGLKIPASDIAATANQIIQSKYGFAKIGDFGIELRQKDNNDMKVLKPNSSQEVTLKEALIELATERGWIEKPAAATSGAGTVAVTPSNGSLKMNVPPHLKAHFEKKMQLEK